VLYFQHWFYKLFETLLTLIVCIMFMFTCSTLAVIQLLHVSLGSHKRFQSLAILLFILGYECFFLWCCVFKQINLLTWRTVLWCDQHADQNWYALYSDLQYENIAVSHYNQVHLVDHEHLSIIHSGISSPRQQQQQQQQPDAARRHHDDSLNDAGIQELHTWSSNYREVCFISQCSPNNLVFFSREMS